MENFEIEHLRELKKAGNNLLWKKDVTELFPVLGFNMHWVEDPEFPELDEPVAVLPAGKVVALWNVNLQDFHIIQPVPTCQPQNNATP